MRMSFPHGAVLCLFAFILCSCETTWPPSPLEKEIDGWVARFNLTEVIPFVGTDHSSIEVSSVDITEEDTSLISLVVDAQEPGLELPIGRLPVGMLHNYGAVIGVRGDNVMLTYLLNVYYDAYNNLQISCRGYHSMPMDLDRLWGLDGERPAFHFDPFMILSSEFHDETPVVIEVLCEVSN